MARGSERSEQNTQKIQRHQHHDKQNTHGTHGYGQARADSEIASTPNISVESEKHRVSENQFDLQDSNRMDTHSYASVSHTYDSEQDRLQVKTAIKVADEYDQEWANNVEHRDSRVHFGMTLSSSLSTDTYSPSSSNCDTVTCLSRCSPHLLHGYHKATGQARSDVLIPHVKQILNWDCGLACVLMALQALGVEGCCMEALTDLCPTTSVWTIDLAHLLNAFGVRVHFFTITIGANPDFAQEKFYKDTMAEDGMRVEKLFRQAETAGINVQRKSIEQQELVDIVLSKKYIVILLVDKLRLLYRNVKYALSTAQTMSQYLSANEAQDIESIERTSSLSSEYVLNAKGYFDKRKVGSTLPVDVEEQSRQSSLDLVHKDRFSIEDKINSYTGHYLVLCAYCASTDCYECRDPAVSVGTLFISATVLERARKAFGTDEDILLASLGDD